MVTRAGRGITGHQDCGSVAFMSNELLSNQPGTSFVDNTTVHVGKMRVSWGPPHKCRTWRQRPRPRLIECQEHDTKWGNMCAEGIMVINFGKSSTTIGPVQIASMTVERISWECTIDSKLAWSGLVDSIVYKTY